MRNWVTRLRVFIGGLACLALPAMGSAAESVTVLKDDLKPLEPVGWMAPGIEFPSSKLSAPWIADTADSAAATQLRRLRARHGGHNPIVTYDNRDRGHSEVSAAAFPALPRLHYGPELRKINADIGLAGRILYPFPVIGNSSMAHKGGSTARSLPRMAMTSPKGALRAFATYANNHIYMYPEHRDYDDADMFPANWPYTVISQGSSGSDRVFLSAYFMAMAALPDKTREMLRKRNLLAPTLQMILRRNMAGIYKREDYYSTRAHPTVFDGRKLAPERMVAYAASLKPGDVPPMLQLRVEAEDFQAKAGLADLSEKLFDTPSAIARVWRGYDYRREMTVSVAETKDPNGRELRFEWVVLRGDPERVKITLLDGPGSRAKIELQWHNMPVTVPALDTLSHRIDIGVFAYNGAHDSAPAFISISFPTHEKRLYETQPASGRVVLKSVDYHSVKARHYDPLLHWRADWRDEFAHDDAGEIVGWRRVHKDGSEDVFAADGPKPVYEMTRTKRGPRLVLKPGG